MIDGIPGGRQLDCDDRDAVVRFYLLAPLFISRQIQAFEFGRWRGRQPRRRERHEPCAAPVWERIECSVVTLGGDADPGRARGMCRRRERPRHSGRQRAATAFILPAPRQQSMPPPDVPSVAPFGSLDPNEPSTRPAIAQRVDRHGHLVARR